MKKVVALVERYGRARSFHVANIHAGTVRGAIVTNIDRQSTLMTDDARFYWDKRCLHARPHAAAAKSPPTHNAAGQNPLETYRRHSLGKRLAIIR